MFQSLAYQHILGTQAHIMDRFTHGDDRHNTTLTNTNGFTNTNGTILAASAGLEASYAPVYCHSSFHGLPANIQTHSFQYPSRLIDNASRSIEVYPMQARAPTSYLSQYPSDPVFAAPYLAAPCFNSIYASGIQSNTLPATDTEATNNEASKTAASRANTIVLNPSIPSAHTSAANTINPRETYIEPPAATDDGEDTSAGEQPPVKTKKDVTATESDKSEPKSPKIPPAASFAPITSFETARAWKNRIREKMPKPSVPVDVDKQPETYVDSLCNAMKDTINAQDGRRELPDGTLKRESTGFRQFVTGEFDERDIKAGCWLLLETTIKLHHEGCRLRPSQLPAPVRDGRSEVELSFEERFEAVKELLKTEKMAAKDVIDGGEYDCMRIARCPLAIKRDKVNYRKTNDRRPSQAKHKLESSTPSKASEDEGDTGKGARKRARLA